MITRRSVLSAFALSSLTAWIPKWAFAKKTYDWEKDLPDFWKFAEQCRTKDDTVFSFRDKIVAKYGPFPIIFNEVPSKFNVHPAHIKIMGVRSIIPHLSIIRFIWVAGDSPLDNTLDLSSLVV